MRSSAEYRSMIDTPFRENNVMTYNVSATSGFTVAGILPLTATFTIRESNSAFFTDIFDYQIGYDSYEFRRLTGEVVKNKLLLLYASIEDSLSEKLLHLKEAEVARLKNLLYNPFQLQKLVEANEFINVKRLTYNPAFSEEVNHSIDDSIRKASTKFISIYNESKDKYESYENQVDSLKQVVSEIKLRRQQFKNLLESNGSDFLSPESIFNMGSKYAIQRPEMPRKYRWLLCLRTLNLGRSNINHSDLIAKNVSLNGINFEYSSWYYVAGAAGGIDFRFRDYAVGIKRDRQHLNLIRAG